MIKLDISRFSIIMLVVGLTAVISGCSSPPPIGTLDDSGTVVSDDAVVLGKETEQDADPLDSDSVSNWNIADGTYSLDVLRSTLGWSATKITSNYHEGFVGITDGNLVIFNEKFTGGKYKVDLNTITESKNSERVVIHLKSADFFDVEKYPTSTFVISSITPDAIVGADTWDGFYTITGHLTIKDQTHELSFPAVLKVVDGELHVTADFEIDRTAWGIVYSSGSIVKDLGDKAIKDEVQFKLDLLFVADGE